MTDAVCESVALVQRLTRYYESRNHYLTECCEEALNDLVRSPDRCGEPLDLVRSAMRNARKKIRRRSEIATIESITPLVKGDERRGILGEIAAPDVSEQPPWLGSLTARNSRLVALDTLGFSSEEIAADLGVAKPNLYVLMSRARAAARAAFRPTLVEAA